MCLKVCVFLFAVALVIMVSNASPDSGGTVKVGGADGGRVYGTYEQYDDGLGVAGFYRGKDGGAFYGAYREGQGLAGYDYPNYGYRVRGYYRPRYYY